ncbi:MAG: ornithine carbamoyltransferase [SAR202 cluster bacterium]|nr:ornithine carbamoyltransferase [SAR202 cluster bacterium]
MTAQTKVRHFLSMSDLSPGEIADVLERATAFKKGDRTRSLAGRNAVLIFEKPSLRTKLTFDIAVHELGGHPIYMAPQEVMLGKREPVKDVARMVSRVADLAVVRTFGHALIEEFAQAASIPVVNALSDAEHPCQALADLLTIRQHFGGIKGVRVAYIGDGNNVAASLALGLAATGGHLTIASPAGYELPERYAGQAISIGQKTGGTLSMVRKPASAAKGADFVYTDVWTSMGQEAETAIRLKAFAGYQVNPPLLDLAGKGVKFMHDMPAHPGEEISQGLFDDPRSIVFDQAENRLHAQAGLLDFLFS